MIAKLVLYSYSQRPVGFAGDQPTRGAPPRVTDADRKDLRQRLSRLCPGYDNVKGRASDRGTASTDRYRAIYKHCRLDRLGAMTEWEFVAHRPVTELVLVIFDALVRSGMNLRAARVLASFFLPPDDWGELSRRLKMELPRGRSTTGIADTVDLIVSRQQILLRNRPVAKVLDGRVEPSAKRDGPDGYFIDPLFERLGQEVKKLRAAHRQGGHPFKGNLILMADRRTSFRLLVEIIYTASQAEFSRFQLLVTHPHETHRAILIETPRLSRGHPASQPAPAAVTITDTGYLLKPGADAEAQTFPFVRGKRAEATRSLAHALWKLRSRAVTTNPPRTWGTVTVRPNPRVTVQQLVDVLDATREVPRDAKDPPVPATRSTLGCGLTFSAKTQQWTLAKDVVPACMFPFPVLALGAE